MLSNYIGLSTLCKEILKKRSKKVVESELNKVLDSKDIQDDKVFKKCIKDCKK